MVGDGDGDSKNSRAVFRGDVRYIRCGDVTGEDCDRAMPNNAENCGIDTHLRVVAIGATLGDRLFRSRQRKKPRLIVDEDYELLEDEPGDPVPLDESTFDPSSIWVATKVQGDFTSYHRVSAEQALQNIRLVLIQAVQSGGHQQMESGFHRFSWSGFVVFVTPDLGVVVRYSTNHFERTPRMVADGLKSRLGRRARRAAELAAQTIPDDLEVGGVRGGTVVQVVGYGAFIDIGSFEALLHRTEMTPDGHDPHEFLTEGDELTVRVKSIDRDLNRVALTVDQPLHPSR